MSSWPGPDLEDFLADYHGLTVDGGAPGMRAVYAGQHELTGEQFVQVVELWEPLRGDIERYLLDYEEEENGSWRDYKYFTICEIEGLADIADKAHALILSFGAPRTKGLLK